MGIDILSMINNLEEKVSKGFLDIFLADEDSQLLIECLHNNGMSYKSILNAIMEYTDKRKERKAKE